jgi:hypothetical protein
MEYGEARRLEKALSDQAPASRTGSTGENLDPIGGRSTNASAHAKIIARSPVIPKSHCHNEIRIWRRAYRHPV